MCTRRVSLWFFLLGMALALAPAASAQTPDQARKAIQALYDKENAALSKKDTSVILADLAPSFVAVRKDGTQISYAQTKKDLTSSLKLIKSIKNKGVIQKFQLNGHTAVVTLKEHTEYDVTNPQTQKTVHLSEDSLSEDTWMKNEKGWQRTHTKEISTTMNSAPPPAK